MTTRLVDPIHLFNEFGEPVMTFDYLLERIEELEEKVEKLERQNRGLMLRLKALGDDLSV